MKLTRNQSGFTAVEILLVAVLVGALATVGYFAYQNMQNAKKTTTTTPSPSASATPANPNELVIIQFGAKMTLPAGLAGLTYTFEPESTNTDAAGKPFTTAPIARLVSAQLKDQPTQCMGKGAAEIAALTSYTTLPNDPQQASIPDNLVKKIGDKYIVLGLPNGGPCFTGALAKTETDQRALIMQTFQTLSAK
jgi:prepilin-type N-terminal cleavage/methylation domain-containing protein